MERTNRGGREGPDGWVFELSGGRLCLDFANTVDERATEHPRELLRNEADLTGFLAQSGMLSRDVAASRRRGSNRRRHLLSRARGLREALFEVFSALARGGRPQETALGEIEAWLPRAYARPGLEPQGEGYRLAWAAAEDPIENALLAVVRSAVDLLGAPERSRVRLCAAERCAWLFLDESRNRSRQWCDMSVCGNREKARRHYRRARAARG
jgi:predicted RNA-binding Zn ribbon-like protein